MGATLCLELASHGVASTLIDRSSTASRHPKMDFLNGRSMELFRRLGMSEEIRSLGIGADHAFNFIWTLGFDQEPVAEWRYPSVAQLRHSNEGINDGTAPLEPYQRVLGSLLEDLGRRRAAAHPLVDVRTGLTFTGLEQGPDGVTAHLVDSATAEPAQIQARFLVGCDGANSAVRSELGIPVDSVGPTAWHRDVYFRSSDPVLRKHGRAFLTISARGLTLVSRDEEDTWTGAFPLPLDGAQVTDPVAEMHRRLGAEFRVDEVITTADWQGSLSVAESYRQGSVFLAGDSAHQFFPTGGHGANTGLGDAVDLGWKLAGVMNGWGGPGLLDSYQAERRPVALFNREMCFNLLEVWRRFPQLAADGASPQHLAGFLDQERHQVENVGIHFGYRYDASPIVCSEDGPAPAWDWRRITSTTWPGCRVPSVRLPDGSALFDLLGRDLTLVDLSGENAGKPLVDEAVLNEIPVKHLPIDSDDARQAWERSLVLVRPDQHVAWRGSSRPPDWGAVLDHIRGKSDRRAAAATSSREGNE